MRPITLALVLVVVLAFVFVLPVGAHGGHTECAQIVREATAAGFVPAGPAGQGVSGAAVSDLATSAGPGSVSEAVAIAHTLFCAPAP